MITQQEIPNRQNEDMLGTITNHNNMDINTLQKHMVPNGTSESTLGPPPPANH